MTDDKTGGTEAKHAVREQVAEMLALLGESEERFPGIAELVEAYSTCEEIIGVVDLFQEIMRPEPIVITSNQSCSD